MQTLKSFIKHFTLNWWMFFKGIYEQRQTKQSIWNFYNNEKYILNEWWFRFHQLIMKVFFSSLMNWQGENPILPLVNCSREKKKKWLALARWYIIYKPTFKCIRYSRNIDIIITNLIMKRTGYILKFGEWIMHTNIHQWFTSEQRMPEIII